MRTRNMSQSIEPEQSATDQCDGSSTELTKAMATLSVNTPGANTASKQFSFPPVSSTTPFGSSGSVSGPPSFGTSSTPPSGSSALFHVTSKPASGVGTSSTLLSVTGTSESGAKSSPLFGVPKTPASYSQSSLFGAPKTSAFGGAPSTPLFGQSSTPASTSPGFGLFGASRSPTFGVSNKPAFGTSSPLSFGTPSSIPNALQHDPFHVSAKPAFTSSAHPFNASGNPQCWHSGTPNCGVSNPPFNASTTFQLPGSSNPGFSASGSLFGTSHTSSPFGGFSKTTTTGGFGSTSTPAFGFSARPFEGSSGPCFGMSCASCAGRRDLQLPISGFASWSPFWKDPVRLSSICTMLACSNIDLSYEQLRWREYCRRNRKGEFNKSAHVNRIDDNDSDMITIKIKAPSRVAAQLLEALGALHINADSSSMSHGQSAPVFGIPFSLTRTESSAG